jgi:radical SAM protein with 4Fe4S-binding SPASM domain
VEVDPAVPAHVPVPVVPALVPAAGDKQSRGYFINQSWHPMKLSNPFTKMPEPSNGNGARGLHHYLFENEFGKTRVHLRLENDGSGMLIVNANQILHLNATAAQMAHLFLEKIPENNAIQKITKQFKVSRKQAQQDYTTIKGQLEELIHPNGACLIHDMNLEILAPFSMQPESPYRMDLALTYRCNNDCAHCYNLEHPGPNPFNNGKPELSTDDWKKVLDICWQLNIPHIIFTGGEPTLRSDLLELITYAESIGQITGLNTNARRLSDKRFVDELVKAGLDHVQITLESHMEDVHDQMVGSKGAFRQTVRGIQNVLDSSLFVMTNTTMLRTNVSSIPGTLDFLAELGVPTVGLNALIHSGRGATVGNGLPEAELIPVLEMAKEKTTNAGQRLIWYTPTQYCNLDPMALDLGIKGCTAALYNMCIEPDGAVLPCQSYYKPLGNILTDEWDSIWNHNLSKRLRNREGTPEKCDHCLLLKECGGGCPLQFEEVEETNKVEFSIV